MKITRSPTRLLSKLTADGDLDMLTLYQVKRLASPASGEALRKGNKDIANAEVSDSAEIAESKINLAKGTQALWDKIIADIATHAGLFTGVHGITVVRKTADETVNNSATLQNDNDIVVAVGANEVCLCFVGIFCISPSTTPDIDYAFAVPSGGAIRIFRQLKPDGVWTFIDGTGETTIGVETTERLAFFYALYIGGGTAGNLQLQWAQKTATSEDTKIKAQSFMSRQRLA